MNGNEHLWRQFEKLGEMMGDGLHHEADGKWISVEYKKLAKILCPEGFAEIRKQKSEALNKAIQKKIEIDKFNYIHYVNGTDYMAGVREILGV